ncbi:hypothetical protein [Phaeobacter sp. HF9A]|uniref:hypothetical protein n=1 Tax=Phaeobacter sp. HF9A TaxID=2721561 RepID=UPI0014307E2E|nr:hypothetical protein [Phaeobacter sp. HF9A]NIZ13961.1 hypothetical protein [Phaeobacter sp. HF9A]
MRLQDQKVLVLVDDIHLGHLLCDVIGMYRIGHPELSMSELDACQMMESQQYDICILDSRLRGQSCDQAVTIANAKSIPVVMLTDTDGAPELQVRPLRGRMVQKPAGEEDIRSALEELLGTEPAP